MDCYTKAKEMMDMDAVEFVGGVSKEKIKDAEKELAVNFPKSYKAFLADFGGGDIGGEIIFGLTGSEEDDIIIVTKMERSQGLPKDLVIIAFWSDTLICLDIGEMDEP